MNKRVGILAPQEVFRGYGRVLEELGCEVTEVTKAVDLENIHGLIIAGEEITIIEDLLRKNHLEGKLKEAAKSNLPIFGICAGVVVLSKKVKLNNPYSLGLMDMTVKENENDYDGQSVEKTLDIPALGFRPVRVLFNDAFYIKEIAPNVGILAEHEGEIVFVRQGNMLASVFYPAIKEDHRISEFFIEIINEEMKK